MDKGKTAQLIVISHATPEESAFVLWLGARLAVAGYTVWSDVTRLIGGETHWDDITAAIRGGAAKVVSVCSKVSVGKTGFKNELSLALAVEAQGKLRDFVIPARFDDLAYDNLPTEIIRRNAIDFHSGWQAGLSKLLKKLEADGVPRVSTQDSNALSTWSKDLLRIDADVQRVDEPVVSNILAVKGAPGRIAASGLRPGVSAAQLQSMTWPLETRGRLVYSFARLDQIDAQQFSHEGEVNFHRFIDEGGGPTPPLAKQEARNVVASLFRQAWGRHAVGNGLLGVTFAQGRAAYFVAAEDGGGQRIPFKGPTGIKGTRALNGYSVKNSVYWHYAPEFYPQIGKRLSFSVSPHVIFSEDGRTPLDDVARAHRLRRRFCKNWWQDRWRDLMLAYLTRLSGDSGAIAVALGPSAFITISTDPDQFIAPVTASAPTSEPVADEPEDIAVEDDEADDEGQADDSPAPDPV